MLMEKLKSMSNAPETRMGRRGFLLAAVATTAGLAIGFRDRTAYAADGVDSTTAPFHAYLEIDGDGGVTVLSSQFDMGQGSYNGIATLLAEELGCDWSKISVRGESGNTDLYGNLVWGGAFQGTGGSSSMASSWDRYREAGAAAREMLKAAAARDWGVPAGEIEVSDGTLRHAASSRTAGFGNYAKAAAGMPVPEGVALKPRSEWRLIGNDELRRFDTAPKTNGTHDFTIDVQLDGMVTAVMIHPPRFGATLKSFDAEKARAIPGVVDVVAIHRGIAVVGRDMWSAIKGRDAVTAEWDESEAETRSSDTILSQYRALSEKPPVAVARDDGDVEGAFAAADRVLEATFEFPYLAHAAMEPLNAVAAMNADGELQVWGGHQMPDLYRGISAKIADLPPEKVHMHIMKTGGGFGRRAVPDGDVVSEAVAVAKALDWSAPVKVQWTRDNDIRGGRYRPAYVHRLRAGLDSYGNLIAWDNHIVGQSIASGTPFQGLVQNGVDLTSVEGSHNLPYRIDNMKVGLTTTESAIPVLWWRAVGSTHTAYATEVFIDEVAEAAGADPVDFRLSLLKDKPRHVRTLKLAAEKAGWGGSLPEGWSRGVSVHESFGTVVAQVAEVEMADGSPRVRRVTAAVDCGTAINPDTIRAQIEGGIGFGLGSVMQEEVTLTDGIVDQENYDTYRPLRIDAMPAVAVHIVESDAPPTGVGEPGTPPIGPAVANAIYKATGQRIRILPFAKGLNA